MKFFEWDISTSSLTSKVADQIFNPANQYTGVIFTSRILYSMGKEVTFGSPALIARFWTNSDDYWLNTNFSCSMTEIKRYLVSMDAEEKLRNKLCFIEEINCELKKEYSHPELWGRIIRLKNPCIIKIQKSDEVKSYGNQYSLLVLDSFCIKCKSFG